MKGHKTPVFNKYEILSEETGENSIYDLTKDVNYVFDDDFYDYNFDYNFDLDGNSNLNKGIPKYINYNDYLKFIDLNYLNKEEKASYVYSKNKNVCSGYFCSFIPLPNHYNKGTNKNKYNYFLKTDNEKYLKQLTNEASKYNKEYINELRLKCSDIIISHSGNPELTIPTQYINNYDNTIKHVAPIN